MWVKFIEHASIVPVAGGRQGGDSKPFEFSLAL